MRPEPGSSGTCPLPGPGGGGARALRGLRTLGCGWGSRGSTRTSQRQCRRPGCPWGPGLPGRAEVGWAPVTALRRAPPPGQPKAGERAARPRRGLRAARGVRAGPRGGLPDTCRGKAAGPGPARRTQPGPSALRLPILNGPRAGRGAVFAPRDHPLDPAREGGGRRDGEARRPGPRCSPAERGSGGPGLPRPRGDAPAGRPAGGTSPGLTCPQRAAWHPARNRKENAGQDSVSPVPAGSTPGGDGQWTGAPRPRPPRHPRRR